MILERLAVSGFRGFAERVEIALGPGLTVIHAANGTGKSTLLDALYFGLLERHTVTGDKAERRFLSLGRDLTPAIEIDFAFGSDRYRVRKSFLKAAKSELQRFESGRYVAFKDAVAADDFIRELLCAESPGRGALEPAKHLGLAHILWAAGRAGFDDVPEEAGDKIREMLGVNAVAVTEGERVVQDRVTNEFLRYFTAKKDAYATGAGTVNVPAIEARLAVARENEVAARQQYAMLERLTVDYADRRQEAIRLNATRAALRQQIDVSRIEARTYANFLNEVERATREETVALVAYQELAARSQRIAALRADREHNARAQADAVAQIAPLLSTQEELEAKFRVARTDAENASAAVAAVEQRAANVTASETYVAASEAVQRLNDTLGVCDAAAEELRRLGEAHDALVAPTAEELVAIRQTAVDCDKLQTLIAASALSLEIDARCELIVDVIAGQPAGELSLLPGRTAKVTAQEASVVLDIPGIGRLRVQGTDGAAQARKKLKPLVEAREATKSCFGTDDVPELARRTERRGEIDRGIESAQRTLQERLGSSTVEELRAARASHQTKIDSLEQRHPAWRKNYPDAAALRVAFDDDLRAGLGAVRVAQATLDGFTKPRGDVQASLDRLRNRQLALQEQSNAITTELVRVEADGLDDLARDAAVERASLAWTNAKNVVASIQSQLARYAEDPRENLAYLERCEREAATAYEDALAQEKTLRANLDALASLGSYAKLVAAEEVTSQCDAELASAVAQAKALKLLRDAFERVRVARVAAVVEPIAKASTSYLTRIIGAPIGSVRIEDGLSPGGLIEAGSGLEIGIEGTLSSGEKEQIYLATRLAIAEVIADKRGRQLFVVDDAATATDPSRLRRFVAILEELAREQLQIIVTTADRTRYLGIDGANHIDLAELLMSGAAR